MSIAENSYQKLAGNYKNTYLYNGKEFQGDLGLGWHDYGWRQYDPIAGRFWTQDRFSEKYYTFSPYSYGANNPIKYIDINGDSLWISYGDNQRILYTTGMEYVGDDSFVASTIEVLNGLVSSGADTEGVISTLAGDENSTIINETGWDTRAANTGEIEWSPEGGIITKSDGRQSPAMGLLHELGHSYWDFYDPLNFSEPSLGGGTKEEWDEYYKKLDLSVQGNNNNHEHSYIVGTIENKAVEVLNKVYPQYPMVKRTGNKDISYKFRATQGVFSTTGEEKVKVVTK